MKEKRFLSHSDSMLQNRTTITTCYSICCMCFFIVVKFDIQNNEVKIKIASCY